MTTQETTRVRELEAALADAYQGEREAWADLWDAIAARQRDIAELCRALGASDRMGAMPPPAHEVGAAQWCHTTMRDVILPEIERLQALRRDLDTIAALLPRSA